MLALALLPLALTSIAPGPQQSLDDLPPDQARSLRAAIVESLYRVEPATEGVWVAPNPAQGMQSRFAAHGIEVTGRDEERGPWSLGLSLKAWGRAGSLSPVSEAERVATRMSAQDIEQLGTLIATETGKAQIIRKIDFDACHSTD